jgi:hypothetical protein
MEARIFYGITPQELAQSLAAQFNRGNLRAQQMGNDKHRIVQITTLPMPASGGTTALTVSLQQAEDGTLVQIGKQDWLGVAASLGKTAFATWRNPWNLIDRLDDVAQDIDNLQLSDQVWQAISAITKAAGATHELSDRLRRIVCAYCNTANPVGESNCVACGAPLGLVQPRTCRNCGFVVKSNESTCPNCGKAL